ncbi:hypothetical protein Vretifemale_10008, partial [Volvox reticuliferus]
GSDRSSSSNSQRSKLANVSNGSASNGSVSNGSPSNGTQPSTGSPIGSVEEQLAALGAGGAAAAALVPPSLPPPAVRISRRRSADGSSIATQAMGDQAQWSELSGFAAAGHGGLAGVSVDGDRTGSSISPMLSPFISTPHDQMVLLPSSQLSQPSRDVLGTDLQGGTTAQVAAHTASAAVTKDTCATATATGAGDSGSWDALKGGRSFRWRGGAVAEAASFVAGSIDVMPAAMAPAQLMPLSAAPLKLRIPAVSLELEEDVLTDPQASPIKHHPTEKDDTAASTADVDAAASAASPTSAIASRHLAGAQCPPSPTHLASYRAAAAAAVVAGIDGRGPDVGLPPAATAAGGVDFTAAAAAAAAAMDAFTACYSDSEPAQNRPSLAVPVRPRSESISYHPRQQLRDLHQQVSLPAHSLHRSSGTAPSTGGPSAGDGGCEIFVSTQNPLHQLPAASGRHMQANPLYAPLTHTRHLYGLSE